MVLFMNLFILLYFIIYLFCTHTHTHTLLVRFVICAIQFTRVSGPMRPPPPLDLPLDMMAGRIMLINSHCDWLALLAKGNT